MTRITKIRKYFISSQQQEVKLYELIYQEVKAIEPEFKLTELEYEAIKIE